MNDHIGEILDYWCQYESNSQFQQKLMVRLEGRMVWIEVGIYRNQDRKYRQRSPKFDLCRWEERLGNNWKFIIIAIFFNKRNMKCINTTGKIQVRKRLNIQLGKQKWQTSVRFLEGRMRFSVKGRWGSSVTRTRGKVP